MMKYLVLLAFTLHSGVVCMDTTSGLRHRVKRSLGAQRLEDDAAEHLFEDFVEESKLPQNSDNTEQVPSIKKPKWLKAPLLLAGHMQPTVDNDVFTARYVATIL